MASNTIKGLTIEIGGDTTKLGKALKDVESKSRNLSKELGDVNKLLKMDPGNLDALKQKQEILAQAVQNTSKKLQTLKEAEKQVQQQFERGEASEEQVRALQREIIATTNKLKGYEKAAKNTAEAIEKLGDGSDDASDGVKDTGKEAGNAAGKVDDFADAAKDAEKSSRNMGATLAGAAKVGLQAVAAAAGAALAGLTAAAESTRDYRQEMGKLNTAFTQSGFSSEAATGAYQELVGVLGETDQSVEAANHLAKLTDNEQDLAKWTGDILPGVFATFGDSLPIEGLTEAANETAKVGAVTGPLADALNWAGVSEDEFNASLEKCTSEQERQALITETLTGLYGKASKAYKETNKDVIAANKANDAWMSSLAGIGAAVDPVITDVKMLGASLLSEAVPGVQALADAFRRVLSGDSGATEELGAALSGLITGVLQKITEMLPTVVQVGMSLISTLVTTLLGQLPQIVSAGGQMVSQLVGGIAARLPDFIQTAISLIGNFVTGLQNNLPLVLAKGAEMVNSIGSGIRANLPALVSQALDVIMNFAQTLYDNAPALIETGFNLLSNLVQGIMDTLPVLLSKAPEIISKFANIINDNFPTILQKGVQLIGQIILGIIKAIPTLIKNVPKIISAIVDVWEAFNWLNLGKKAITALKDGVLKMVGSVKTAGKNVMDAAVNAIKNLPQSLMNLGKTAISGLGSAIRGAASGVKAAATSILNTVVSTFKGLPSKMLSVGKDLVRGLWNGISDMAGWVIGKIKGFSNSVLKGIKSFFGVASPSKETAWIGEMLDQGLAEGVLDNARDPIRAMQRVSAGVLDAANSDLDGMAITRQLSRPAAYGAVSAASDGGLGAKLDKILSAIERGQVLMLDGDTLVGATASRMDNKLGQRRALAARGAV